MGRIGYQSVVPFQDKPLFQGKKVNDFILSIVVGKIIKTLSTDPAET